MSMLIWKILLQQSDQNLSLRLSFSGNLKSRPTWLGNTRLLGSFLLGVAALP
jgi:hypothetical protein